MSVRLEVQLLQRDFSAALGLPDLRCEVNRYSHHIIGGPEEASLTAYGSEWALWALLEGLRAPVNILDEFGDAVWWGFLEEVTVRAGGIEVGVSLKTMHNRVAVAYSAVAAGQTTGSRATTAWAQDDDSVAVYGIKELLVPGHDGALERAEARRDAVLAVHRYPLPVPGVAPGRGSLSATLLCRGWWDTLAWRYYANTGTDDVETTEQIGDVLAAAGAFLTGVDVRDASGIDTSEYADGDSTALKVVEALLAAGTVNGRRLLATVTPGRELRVYAEPERNPYRVPYYLTAAGLLTNWRGDPVGGHTCPVGVWCGMKDVYPPSLDASKLADPTLFFIDRSEFDPQSQVWTLEPRGVASPWAVARLDEG